MALPINVDELLLGQSIEWERLEFKEGWNPVNILHSICAFANDLNNWGGGYIIIGIKERNGTPQLPPVGIKPGEIDKIQKKLIELCHRITPHYFPLVVPFIFKEKHILIIWCPGGDVRPYKAPESLEKKALSRYFIRRYSSTVKANHQEEIRLMQLTAKIPFDDRIHHQAAIEDLNIAVIKSFLKEIGSDLYQNAGKIPFEKLCRQMQLVRGPDEYLKPINCGLLFFCLEPHKYFKGATIEVVRYHNDVGDKFEEKIFTGPLHEQLRLALKYIKDITIIERVEKIDGHAEARRYFNFPFEAIEEALANAVYHRSYELLNPIEVNIWKSRIEIISFPGPMPPITNEDLKKEKVIVRDYRNRRIGDILKELDLTEGRSTGIPKIRRRLKQNGSPEPLFKTDEHLSYFLSTIYVHPEFVDHKIDSKENATLDEMVNTTQREILIEINKDNTVTYDRLAELLDKERTTIYRNIKDLMDMGILRREGSRKQGIWQIKNLTF